MAQFVIIETYTGMTVAEVQPGIKPEEMAAARGAVVVDPGPYPTYDEAYDAMLALRETDEDDDA